MNKRFYSTSDFKLMLLRLVSASDDCVALQKLEAEIVDTYKETTMTHYQYEGLSHVCAVLLESWRFNHKQQEEK